MSASNARHRLWGVVASLLLAGAPLSASAAEVLELQLDGMAVPVDLAQLEAWSRDPYRDRSDLAVWLNLLEPSSRRNLAQLLQAPLLRNQSLGQQLLRTWTGEQLLGEVAQLLQPDSVPADGRQNAASVLGQTLNALLQRDQEVTTLQLLRALPTRRVSLKLDGVIELAQQWREQLELQRQAMRQLRTLGLPKRQSQPLQLSQHSRGPTLAVPLPVAHRSEPLPLQIWPSDGPPQGAWVVLMPGLGGDSDQLGWLASGLAHWGWPVVVLDHPGSDETALKASLVGQRPPPGAESIQERLADVNALLQAQRRGALPQLKVPAGAPVVLMGHSLGGLTALLAAGLQPEPGLEQRCRSALRRLPLTNLSRLLQCRLPSNTARQQSARGVAAVVSFNGFGSLLWPQRGLSALKLPVLMVGGTLDLITPPLSEQLSVFAGSHHPRNRLVLIEGASHFSPVRMAPDRQAVFQLGDDLVGPNPRQAQELLLQLTLEFLQGLSEPLLLSPQLREQRGMRAHVLDGQLARRWQSMLKTRAEDPTGPPPHPPSR